LNKTILFFALIVLSLCLISCDSDNANNNEDTYSSEISDLENQIGQLNTVIEELSIVNQELKHSINLETIDDNNDEFYMDLVRTEEIYGEILINSNAEIMSSPYEDAKILIQIQSELSAYCEYVVRNNYGQRWILVRIADTSMGFVRESDVEDIEDDFEDYSGEIEAEGIKQNISIYPIINVTAFSDLF